MLEDGDIRQTLRGIGLKALACDPGKRRLEKIQGPGIVADIDQANIRSPTCCSGPAAAISPRARSIRQAALGSRAHASALSGGEASSFGMALRSPAARATLGSSTAKAQAARQPSNTPPGNVHGALPNSTASSGALFSEAWSRRASRAFALEYHTARPIALLPARPARQPTFTLRGRPAMQSYEYQSGVADSSKSTKEFSDLASVALLPVSARVSFDDLWLCCNRSRRPPAAPAPCIIRSRNQRCS